MLAKDFEIQYQFRFSDYRKLDFLFVLDKDNLALKSPASDENFPDWTRLGFHKCSNCTLKEEDSPYCPVAKEYSVILDSFSKNFSYEKVQVLVKVEERYYFKETSLQAGISSMIGIVNVTCGCPVLSELRPMVRFHLPFGSSEETTFRSAAVFLLGKYLDNKEKKTLPPIDWQELADTLGEVGKVNMGLTERIKNMSSGDANINSLLILDGFAKITRFVLEDGIEGLRYLFKT
ncbi:MAG: hypothetical protein VYC17_02455 [Nitrospinota bacterium]|nr:hypothetical protein [Nitrospinota bacterium]